MASNRYNKGKNVAFDFLVADKANINEKLQSSTIYTNYLQISPNGVDNLKNYTTLNNSTSNYTYLSCPDSGLGKKFLTGARITSGTNNQKVALYVEPGAGRCLFGDEINMFSDERLKDNIKEIKQEECLKTINHLKPVHFNFKDSNRVNFGFIAQDVVRIVPEIVNYIDKFIPDYYNFISCKDNVLTLETEDYCLSGDTLRIMFKNKPGWIGVCVDKVEKNLVYLSESCRGLLQDGECFLYGKFTEDVNTLEEIKLIPFLTGAIKEQQREIKNLEKEVETLKKDVLELKNASRHNNTDNQIKKLILKRNNKTSYTSQV